MTIHFPVKVANCFGTHKVIDVDTHLSEPHDLWTRHAPAGIRDRVPQVKMHNGQMSWVIDGDKSIGDGAPANSSIRKDGSKVCDVEFVSLKMDEAHPGSYSVKDRLAVMDAQGISAQVVYPNLLGFGGQKAALVDPELRLACTRIYNDAMAELQEESGGRLFPMALLPWWDVDLAAAETERAHAMGLRGININSDPQTKTGLNGELLPDLGSTYWDALWEVCSDKSMPVNFHIGGSEQSMDWFGEQGWSSIPLSFRLGLGGAMLFFNNGRVLGNLIYSGVCDRFPQIKFVSVESGIGWIPFMLQALDHQYHECSASKGLERLPSEYFKSNFYGCFWFERGDNLSATIREIGVENVLFETDFPHPTCLYPIDDVAGAMSGLSFDEREKVLSGNASRLYRITI